MIQVPKSQEIKGYKHYIDYMWYNRHEFIEEFDLDDYILVICERIKEVYNFDERVVINYMKQKEYIE